MIRPGELVITDDNYVEHLGDPVIDGERRGRGLIPRDYNECPRGSVPHVHAVDFPLIPRSEWAERITERVALKAQLSDLRLEQGWNSLDQNGQGYCWAYSSTACVHYLRAAMGLPHVRLSAHAVACVIKNFRDQGGWGCHSLEFITERGVPSVEFWAEKSMSRQYDKPETWENAKLYRVTEAWVDLVPAVYSRKLTFDQVCTANLCGIPTVDDYNWWGHSVCGVDVVDGVAQWLKTRCGVSGKLLTLAAFERYWGVNTPTTGYARRIQNSWGNSWSERGLGVLTGNKAIPDGGAAPRVAIAA